MEFEDVNENLEWQAARVAAAFGAKNWRKIRQSRSDDHNFWGQITIGEGEVPLRVSFDLEPFHFEIGASEESTLVAYLPNLSIVAPPELEWSVIGDNPLFNECMARGLYRLGIEEEDVMSQLPQLSVHEKLELRLSMPHEFWPKTWLDEEKKST